MKLRFDILYWTELLHEFTGIAYNDILFSYKTADKTNWDYGRTLDLTKESERMKYYNKITLLIGYVNWHLNVAPKLRKGLADKLHGRVLDYGCGIATQSLIANVERGVQVDLYDIDTVTKGFLKYVIEKHNLSSMKFVQMWDNEVYEGKYDCIVCTDVLEHLDRPITTLRLFKSLLGLNGKLYLRAPFDTTQDPTHHES